MPKVSEFFGISILMFYQDHPPPHFHVYYRREYRATLTIADLRLTRGTLPRRVPSLVLEWAFLQRDELLEAWELARAHKPIPWIEPLAQKRRNEMTHIVKTAHHLGGYMIEVSFADGTTKTIDFTPYLYGEVFEPLREIERFKRFRVDPEFGTLVWDETGADVCPDWIYEEAEDVYSHKVQP